MADNRYAGKSSRELNSDKIGKRREGKRWEVAYDTLVVTVGC